MFTAAVTPLTNYVRALAYSSSLGMFVAGGSDFVGSILVSTSVDGGVTWTAQTTPWDGLTDINSISWSPSLGLFVAGAAGGNGPSLMTSPNGSAWTLRASPVDDNYVFGITWASALGLFVAVTNDYVGDVGYIVTSPDGTNWTIQASYPSDPIIDVSWSPALGMFVACTGNASGGWNLTSFDGVNWQWQDGQLTGVFYPQKTVWVDNLGRFVAIGTDGATPVARLVATSFDGGVTPWVPQATPFDDGGVNAVGVADDGQALVGGNTSSGTGPLMSSSDGMQWRTQPTPLTVASAMAASSSVTVLGGA